MISYKTMKNNSETLIDNFEKSEQLFSSFIDLIPAKIYFNQDDYSNWFKLVTKTNNNNINKKSDEINNSKKEKQNDHSESDSNEYDSDDNNNNIERINKFDPRVLKTVSQILKDFENLQSKNDSTKINNRKLLLSIPTANNNGPIEKNNNIKILNKAKSKSSSDKSAKNSSENESKKADKSNTKKEPKTVMSQKEQRELTLKRKRQRYDSQTEPEIVDIDHLNANSIEKRKPILNKNGQIVFSKFDFTADTTLKTKKPKEQKLQIDTKQKDYKKLLIKLQENKEKMQKLKQTEPEKAAELEIKNKWKTVIERASGHKVKDDLALLKKSVKRIEKKKDKSRKKWEDRLKSVETSKQQHQEKRRKNIEKRKEKNKEKKFKKLRQKGRILPGF